MKQTINSILLTVLMSMFSTFAFAYDIAVENSDGIMIYYYFINDDEELAVAHSDSYKGEIVIPEVVTYMDKNFKVTSINEGAFKECTGLTYVSIPNSVTSLGKDAFVLCSSLTSIIIPNSVTSIGDGAFSGSGLVSVVIPENVTSIGVSTFSACVSLTDVSIPNSVTSIGAGAFAYCFSISSITIPNSVTSIDDDAFLYCESLASLTIPNSVKSIGDAAFANCTGLTSLTIGSSVSSIGFNAFLKCTSLDSVVIPNSVTSIGSSAFAKCTSLKTLTIGKNVSSFSTCTFEYTYISTITSLIENPSKIYGKSESYRIFSRNTFNNAILYVPAGTIEKYKSTEGWKGFVNIQELADETPTTQKCEKPIISYSNGKLLFECETEGAVCYSSISDSDIKSCWGNDIQLSVTYEISVYATKEGYDNSDVVTATLCWIDAEPKTEGITNGVANVRANPVLIQSSGNVLGISGVDAGTPISVYDVSGKQVGSANATSTSTNINTSLTKGQIGIVKIGEKAVKIILK